MAIPERLYELALTVKCRSCGADPDEPCVKPPVAAGIHAPRLLDGARAKQEAERSKSKQPTQAHDDPPPPPPAPPHEPPAAPPAPEHS